MGAAGKHILGGLSVIVPFFSTGQQGKSATVTAQRHLNLYAELTNPSDKAALTFYGRAPLVLRTTFGDTPVRGWIAVGSLYYVVHRGTVYSVDNAGTKTVIGTINTTEGRIDMAYNGILILIVTGTNGYTLTLPSTLAIVSAGDFPDAARTCAWLAGQFIVDQGSGDAFQTSPDGTSWDAADFATAESNPDGLSRVFVDNGELNLAGENTWEFWGISGGADFAFSAITGATGEYGLAARWSLCKFNGGIVALVKPRMGQVGVYFIKGYVFTPITSAEVAYIINGYDTKSDATGFAFMEGEHPTYQINFPTANASWQYDASSQMWSPVEYGLNGNRHRAELQLDFLNQTLVSDYADGNIYDLDPYAESYTDNGEPIAAEIISRHIFNGNKRGRIDQLYVDMQVGVGTGNGQGEDPVVMLQISKNNGVTWGNELWVKLGKVGNYLQRVVWRRLGIARDWTFRIRITDPVKRVFAFGDVNADK